MSLLPTLAALLFRVEFEVVVSERLLGIAHVVFLTCRNPTSCARPLRSAEEHLLIVQEVTNIWALIHRFLSDFQLLHLLSFFNLVISVFSGTCCFSKSYTEGMKKKNIFFYMKWMWVVSQHSLPQALVGGGQTAETVVTAGWEYMHVINDLSLFCITNGQPQDLKCSISLHFSQTNNVEPIFLQPRGWIFKKKMQI